MFNKCFYLLVNFGFHRVTTKPGILENLESQKKPGGISISFYKTNNITLIRYEKSIVYIYSFLFKLSI